MIDLLRQPWPWYVAGPLIGLFVPVLLMLTGKHLGVSSNFQHACSILLFGKKPAYFDYDWKRESGSLLFALGIFFGGFVAVHFLGYEGMKLLPESAASISGAAILLMGGFLVGFGTRWGNGCTSGHAISGLSGLHKSSLIAVCSFFGGGLAVAWLVKLAGLEGLL